MKIYQQRGFYTLQSTGSLLVFDNTVQCFILEDEVRNGLKVKGETAIPYGIYDVILSYSPKFKRYMFMLVGVPKFDGIRFHSGVRDEDTEGCLLPGEMLSIEANDIRLVNSKIAYDKAFIKMKKAWDSKEKITWEIVKETHR